MTASELIELKSNNIEVYKKVMRSHRGIKPQSRTYTIWCGMKQRCTNPNNGRYYDYGGRGITLCDGWETFEGFILDMGECPEDMCIERIDNNKGYSKNNCKWIYPREQYSNMRGVRVIEYNGRTQTLAQWARELNIKANTLYDRLYRKNLPLEKAMTGNLQQGVKF